jgi:serine protease
VTVELEDYELLSGTSMSTPHVTGTVALLLALAPDLNNAEIQRVLETTAVDVATEGWDLETAWGLVNAFEAAKLVAPTAFGLQPNGPKQSPRRRSVRP